MTALAIVGSVACVVLAPGVIAQTGNQDPREVVVDEVAGQAVCFLGAVGWLRTMPAEQIWVVTLAGFLLFRVFDIIKPWPGRYLEKLPAGWGILADDLMAGLYAGIVLHIGIRVIG
jgi:phosphatidylglycerophosphatase A